MTLLPNLLKNPEKLPPKQPYYSLLYYKPIWYGEQLLGVSYVFFTVRDEWTKDELSKFMETLKTVFKERIEAKMAPAFINYNLQKIIQSDEYQAGMTFPDFIVKFTPHVLNGYARLREIAKNGGGWKKSEYCKQKDYLFPCGENCCFEQILGKWQKSIFGDNKFDQDDFFEIDWENEINREKNNPKIKKIKKQGKDESVYVTKSFFECLGIPFPLNDTKTDINYFQFLRTYVPIYIPKENKKDEAYLLEVFLSRESEVFKELGWKNKVKFSEFLSLVYNILIKYREILKITDKITVYGMRSAVAAIMARNMSHNIGSHVLSNYQGSETGKELQFHRYLQARMDYIAYVTTLTPNYGDGFTLDEVVEEFNSNTILVQGLVASEGFSEVKVDGSSSGYQDLLSFPMGELGKQAFFSILEGIARNVAKHGAPAGGGGQFLVLKITTEDEGENVKIKIYDDKETYEKAALDLKINDPNKGEDVRYHKLLDDAGVIQDKFWGIKEMRVGAIFLRKIPIEKIDDINDEKDLALDLKNCDKLGNYTTRKDGNLCYVIKMKKFKHLLIVRQKNGNDFTPGRYIDEVTIEGLRNFEGADYELCVIDKAIQGKLSSAAQSQLPLRLLEVNKVDEDVRGLSENDIVLKYQNRWLENREKNSSKIDIIYQFQPQTNKPGKTKKIEKTNGKIVISIFDKIPTVNEEAIKIKKVQKEWNGFIKVKTAFKKKEEKKGKIILQEHLLRTPELVGRLKGDGVYFLQDVSGNTPNLKRLLNTNQPKDDFRKRLFVNRLREAAIEPIIIFDERIYNQKKKDAAYFQKGQKIIVADMRADKSDSNKLGFYDLEDNEVLSIEKNNGVNGLKYHWNLHNKFTFALFHLGILDKIRDTFGVDVADIIEELLGRTNFEHIVIHSGRGKGLKFSKPLLYMDFTSLQRGIQEGKFHLIQTLYSLKPFSLGGKNVKRGISGEED